MISNEKAQALCDELKLILQTMKPKDLEQMSAALIGKLLDVGVFVARSGFQFGGDAGTAGIQGRRLRIECKRYADNTALDERELFGEIDQALGRDEFLEAWVLVTTRSVDEQLASSLIEKGESLGLPVVIIDWQPHEFPRLIAFCTCDTQIVQNWISAIDARKINQLREFAFPNLNRLKRELATWCLGFDSIKIASHEFAKLVWTDRPKSLAVLGQNAAGGAIKNRIRRVVPFSQLTKWWQNTDETMPACVLGKEGVGKTWVCVDWLIANLNELPIVVIANSSFLSNARGFNTTEVLALLARQLYEFTRVQSANHWEKRLVLLLKKPHAEGPVAILYLDGINENQSTDWVSMLRILQTEPFAGRVHVVVSTRPDHWDSGVGGTNGVNSTISRIDVMPFDISPGGELDQLLKLNEIARSDLRQELLEMCCNARLFSLAIRLREKLGGASTITIHRLLWEYGRDTLGSRCGKSYSEREWTDWLQELASHIATSSKPPSRRTLENLANRPHLDLDRIYNRLSQIVDSEFASTDQFGNVRLDPTLVEHALGLFLLNQLVQVNPATRQHATESLIAIMEPLAGFDQEGRILCAAANIAILNSTQTQSTVVSSIVQAWLTSQNLPADHESEIADLAVHLVDPLLDLVSELNSWRNERSLSIAVNSLRNAIKCNDDHSIPIMNRVCNWFRVISKDLIPGRTDADKFEARKNAEIADRLGSSESGRRKILFVDFEVVECEEDNRLRAGIEILQGCKLASLRGLFEIVSISYAVQPSHCKLEGLEWLCLLNERDPTATRQMLRELSADIRKRSPELGVHPQLPSKCAAILLWLTGFEDDEKEAEEIDTNLGRVLKYEDDYLQNPLTSRFPLERRHATRAIADGTFALIGRIRRARPFFLDPTFVPPPEFISELACETIAIDPMTLDTGVSHSVEDHWLEMCLPAIAAYCPDQLSVLVQKQIEGMNNAFGESVYWKLIRYTKYFVALSGCNSFDYECIRAKISKLADKNKWYSNSYLSFSEFADRPLRDQLTCLVDLDLDGILNDTQFILRPASVDDVDLFIEQFRNGTEKQILHVLVLISMVSVDRLSDSSWQWVWSKSRQLTQKHLDLAFLILRRMDTVRLGKELLNTNWKWDRKQSPHEAHEGSIAIIWATKELPFEAVASRIAPWLLLYAARFRGSNSSDSRLASKLLASILTDSPIFEITDGVLEIQVTGQVGSQPNYRLLDGDVGTPFPSVVDDLFLRKMQEDYHDRRVRLREYLEQTKQSGGDLLLATICPEDVEPVIVNCPEFVFDLLDGMELLSEAFCMRVRRAEYLFLALCEVLLTTDPQRGVLLWRTLQSILAVRYVGIAGVDELLHMIFRVSDSIPVAKIRLELLSLNECQNDEQLFNIALAASYQHREDWLVERIAEDRQSPFVWRQRRGDVLSSFAIGNSLPIPEAWPDGPIYSDTSSLRQQCAYRRWREACSIHWWKAFLAAESETDAYRAWVLFSEAFDRRSFRLLKECRETQSNASELRRKKIAHLEFNRHHLERAAKRREEDMEKNFLGQRIVEGIGPWQRPIRLAD